MTDKAYQNRRKKMTHIVCFDPTCLRICSSRTLIQFLQASNRADSRNIKFERASFSSSNARYFLSASLARVCDRLNAFRTSNLSPPCSTSSTLSLVGDSNTDLSGPENTLRGGGKSQFCIRKSRLDFCFWPNIQFSSLLIINPIGLNFWLFINHPAIIPNS